MNALERRIAVIGVGRLGLPWYALLSGQGYDVTAVDRDLSALSYHDRNFAEPGLYSKLQGLPQTITTTTSVEDAISTNLVSFVMVSTPTGSDGLYSLENVTEVLERIGHTLPTLSFRHTIVLVSTVAPGDCDSVVIPLLEKVSGLTCGKDFGFCYSPDFVALGNVIEDYTHPDFILVGARDTLSYEVAASVYGKIKENDASMICTSFFNAELAKLAINSFLAMKIAFSNSLVWLCSSQLNADVNEVINIVGMDRRISPAFLKPGLPFGGPCLPRDNIAMTEIAKRFNADPSLFESINHANQEHFYRLLGFILDFGSASSIFGFMGLGYKRGAPIPDHSPALNLLRKVAKLGIACVCYDRYPGVFCSTIPENTTVVHDLNTFFAEINILIVCSAEDDETTRLYEYLTTDTRQILIIDCWRIIDPNRVRHRARYVAPGLDVR
jgi:UDPglucose 6-dehydrogenase